MIRQTGRMQNPRPFLKWVGGKRQLLPELLPRVEAAGDFKRYHEPFVGGGALFFELFRTRKLKRQAFLSDNNPRLVDTYIAIRDHVEEIIEKLLVHKELHCPDYYYEVRAEVPESDIERAARIIYLNKTCFNGLYRENSKGLFNTPVGKYKNPCICDADNLKTVATALKKTKINTLHFEGILKTAKAGDFVYFDPPYHPVSQTSSFTSYNKNSFGEDSQRLLHQVFERLKSLDVKALLSNSKTPFIEELYRGHRIDEVQASRTVNSKASKRGKVSELMIRNY